MHPQSTAPWRPAITQLRQFSAKPVNQEASKIPTREESLAAQKEEEAIARRDEEEEDAISVEGFGRSEKASRAAQVNLSARLQKDGKSTGQPGMGEVWRLIKIARPEAKWLGLAFAFLLTSSAITMSIPFSIGKILDLATKDPSEGGMLFGLDLNTFYFALPEVLTMGAAANYGRIIILRIVGERIVARLRSQLYRKTYVQDAEFFDANRVGDLISRLSSDTVIVGKSITQNLVGRFTSYCERWSWFCCNGMGQLETNKHLMPDVSTPCNRSVLLWSDDSKFEQEDPKELGNSD